MNIVETIFSTGLDPHAGIRAIEVLSPAQVLPAANWKTLQRVWQSWSVLNGTGKPGRRVDPCGTSQSVFTENPSGTDRLLLYVKDSLSANIAVEADLARLCLMLRGTPAQFDMFSLNCMGHQAVLTMRPILDRVPDLTTSMVRAGHLWQGGRFYEGWVKELLAIADSSEFREVPGQPREYAQHQAHLDKVLRKTRPCRDIDATGEQFVRTMVTGDPCATRPVHLHTPDCTCGGRRVFKSNMRKALLILYGSGFLLCLLHRWKNFEVNSCFAYRCFPVRQCDVAPRGFIRVCRGPPCGYSAQRLQDSS